MPPSCLCFGNLILSRWCSGRLWRLLEGDLTRERRSLEACLWRVYLLKPGLFRCHPIPAWWEVKNFLCYFCLNHIFPSLWAHRTHRLKSLKPWHKVNASCFKLCLVTAAQKSHNTAHYPSLMFHIICTLPSSCLCFPPGYEGQNNKPAGASQRWKMLGAGTRFLLKKMCAQVYLDMPSAQIYLMNTCVFVCFSM